MRNIEIQMNNAISDSKNWKLANTEVTFDQESGHSRVYLHGNHIATVGDNFVTVTHAGYKTRTTKSRLNAIIREHCVEGESVYQKAGKWFVTYVGEDNKVTHIPFHECFTFC
tara:strand:+ start:1074 stop:1409 length:336 start_codon:yes stop_codon:yes gene_type:complete